MTSAMPETASRELTPRMLLQRRFDLSRDVPTRFFMRESARVAEASRALAQRFERGGRLLVLGSSAEVSDARHVAVEFVHPVLVGKRALPALALAPEDVRTLELIGEPADIVLALGWRGLTAGVLEGVERARDRGLLTLALTGGAPAQERTAKLDFAFNVPCDDPLAVQETHETLYHVLWELVHLFFERRAFS